MKRQILLLLMALPPMLSYAYDAKIDGIYYDFSGGKATVTYEKYENPIYVSDYSGEVVIPESVTYEGTTYSVTSIGDYAFYGCSSLTSVTIPNSDQHRQSGLLWLQQPDLRHHPQQRDQHQLCLLFWLQRPGLCNHPEQRDQHRQLCLLVLQQPDRSLLPCRGGSGNGE